MNALMCDLCFLSVQLIQIHNGLKFSCRHWHLVSECAIIIVIIVMRMRVWNVIKLRCTHTHTLFFLSSDSTVTVNQKSQRIIIECVGNEVHGYPNITFIVNSHIYSVLNDMTCLNTWMNERPSDCTCVCVHFGLKCCLKL